MPNIYNKYPIFIITFIWKIFFTGGLVKNQYN